MIKYSVENPADIKDQLLPLHELHYSEDYRKEAAELDIDWDAYSKMYEDGILVCVVARDEEDNVVGYMSSTVAPHPHNKGSLSGSMDALFVHPDYRNEGVASDLFETTEEILIDAGVSWFSATFRKESTAEAVTGKYGYKKVECTFGKTLRSEDV